MQAARERRRLLAALVFSSAELPEVLCCLRRDVRKQLHLYSPGWLAANGDVCRAVLSRQRKHTVQSLHGMRGRTGSGDGAPKKTIGLPSTRSLRCHCVTAAMRASAPFSNTHCYLQTSTMRQMLERQLYAM